MTRNELRSEICRRLSRKVAEVSPVGVGHWEPAWELVEDPSSRFLIALENFLDQDTPDTRRAIFAAADEVVRAWRRAGQEWEARGRPITSTDQEVPA